MYNVFKVHPSCGMHQYFVSSYDPICGLLQFPSTGRMSISFFLFFWGGGNAYLLVEIEENLDYLKKLGK